MTIRLVTCEVQSRMYQRAQFESWRESHFIPHLPSGIGQSYNQPDIHKGSDFPYSGSAICKKDDNIDYLFRL